MPDTEVRTDGDRLLFNCSNCQGFLDFPLAAAGQPVPCAHCGKLMTAPVPVVATTAPTASMPPPQSAAPTLPQPIVPSPPASLPAAKISAEPSPVLVPTAPPQPVPQPPQELPASVVEIEQPAIQPAVEHTVPTPPIASAVTSEPLPSTDLAQPPTSVAEIEQPTIQPAVEHTIPTPPIAPAVTSEPLPSTDLAQPPTSVAEIEQPAIQSAVEQTLPAPPVAPAVTSETMPPSDIADKVVQIAQPSIEPTSIQPEQTAAQNINTAQQAEFPRQQTATDRKSKLLPRLAIAGVAALAVAALCFGGSRLFSGSSTEADSADGSTSGQSANDNLVVRRDLNFSFQLPDGWKPNYDSNDLAVAGHALVVSFESGGESYRLTIGAAPYGNPAVADSVMNSWRSTLVAAGQSPMSDLTLLESQSINGFRYTKFGLGAGRFINSHGQEEESHGGRLWCAVHRGTVYNLTLESLRPTTDALISETADKLLPGFKLGDPAAEVDPMIFALTDQMGNTVIDPLLDPSTGTQLKGDTSAWTTWPEALSVGSVPSLLGHADQGLRNGDGTYLSFASFIAPPETISSSQLLLAARKIWFRDGQFDGTVPTASNESGAPLTAGGTGSSADVPVQFRMRAQTEGNRYLVVVALSAVDGELSDTLDDALAKIDWESTSEPATGDGWPTEMAKIVKYRSFLQNAAIEAEAAGDIAAAARLELANIRPSEDSSTQGHHALRYLILLDQLDDAAAVKEFAQRNLDSKVQAGMDGKDMVAVMLERIGEHEAATQIFLERLRNHYPMERAIYLADAISAHDTVFNLLGKALAQAQADSASKPLSDATINYCQRVQAETAAAHLAAKNEQSKPEISAHLKKFVSSSPKDAFDLAQNLSSKGSSEASLVIADLLGELHPKSPAAQLVQTLHAIKADNFEAAEALFDKATERDPSSELLPPVFKKLHAAWHKYIQEEIALAARGAPQLEVPKKLLALLRSSDAPAPEVGAFYRFNATVVDGSPGANAGSLVHYQIEVTDEESAEMLNSLRFGLSSEFEHWELRKLVVTDLKGNELARGNAKEAFLQDASTGMATDSQVLTIPVPGVRAGCLIEVELLRWHPGHPAGFGETRHHFGGGLATLKEAFIVMGETNRSDAALEGRVRNYKGNGFRAWVAEDLPVGVAEAWAPKDTGETSVFLAVSDQRWDQIGYDYWLAIEPKFAPSPELTKKAIELARSAGANKIDVIADFVRSQVSYLAIEFGDRAIIPKAPERTLSDRHGDCKDQSTLLCTLLQAAGVEARPVLIRANGRVRPRFPSMSQFDHMIVAVPQADAPSGWRFIDPTQPSAPPTGEAPYGLGGKHSLIINPRGGKLTQLPGGGERMGLTNIDRVVEFHGSDVHVVETVTASEHFSAALAPYMASVADDEEASQVGQAVFFGEAPVGIDLQKTEQLESDGARLRFRFHYIAAGAAIEAGGMLVARLPLLVEAKMLMPPETGGERYTGVQTPAPLGLESRTTARAAGQPLAPAPTEKSGGSRFEQWMLSDDSNTQVQQFELSTEVFDKTDLEPFSKAVRASLASAQAQFVFQQATAGQSSAIAGDLPMEPK